MFELVGLGQLISAIAAVDRYVEFPHEALLVHRRRPPYGSSFAAEQLEAALGCRCF